MKQHGWLPAVALIPQISMPTGARIVTAGRTLPGLNADFALDIVKDFFSIEFLVATNRVKDEGGGARTSATPVAECGPQPPANDGAPTI